MQKIKKLSMLCLMLAVFMTGLSPVQADEFTKEDLKRWEQELIAVVNKGDALFHSGDLGSNTVSCGQCHPNAANTHPETFPKFQKQIGKVVSLAEMINWCLQHPLEGKPLAIDDPKMTALQAYIVYERRGIKLAPGKH